MNERVHIVSLLIGFLFGIGACLIFLRIAGLVSAEVALVGQLAVPLALVFYIWLQVREIRPDADTADRDT